MTGTPATDPDYEHSEARLREAVDAERYRWLRTQQWDSSHLAVVVNPRVAVKLGHDCPALDRLDSLIDSLRSA